MTKHDIVCKILMDFLKQYNLDNLGFYTRYKPISAYIWHKLHKQITKNEIEWQLLEKYLKDNGLNKYFKVTSHNNYEIDLVETDVDDSDLNTLFALKENK